MKKPLVNLTLNPDSGTEMTPEIQEWLDKVSDAVIAVLEENLSQETLDNMRDEFATYGTAKLPRQRVVS